MKKTTTTEPVASGLPGGGEPHDTDLPAGGSVERLDAAASGSTVEGDAPATGRRRKRRELTPAQRALSLLVRREHSQPELLRKLAARGIEPEAAADAVERMREAGWQDDGRFAASLARSRATGGHGPLRIEAELATHRLDAGSIAAAFESLAADGEADWPQRARDLLERRYDVAGFADDPALRRKAVDFLLRRGFDGETAYGAVRALRDDRGAV
ncbi:regulatory protein RecX [Luteimonas sp. SMYT11W]|uniref:Regulatory protein RecX n=1 Tax=Luteimonas flava TaxID=3115822 RepID=A0ABU7WG26_9GAMM